MSETLHASAVVVGGRGVLIRGASGSGKSTLLLALLDRDADAVLVADDRVMLAADGGRIVASAPEAIAGLMEIRGLGIVRRPHVSPAVIDLVVDIVEPGTAPRLPEAPERTATIEGVAVPRIFLVAGAAEGGARVRAALGR